LLQDLHTYAALPGSAEVLADHGLHAPRPTAGRDTAERPGATGNDPILLSLTTSMGWSTYGERMRQEACANPKDNIVFHPFTPSMLGRRMSWQLRYADRVAASLGILDPFTVARWQVAMTRGLRGRYSAAIVATQNLAAGLMRLHPAMPVFIILDATRELYRDVFDNNFIGERELRREGAVFSKAAHIFAASNWAADSVMRTAQIGARRLSVIPPIGFRCRGTPIRSSLFRNGRLQLLFAGLDFERKGGARLLQWQREAWWEFADLHIVTRDRYAVPGCPATTWYGPVDNERLVHEIMPRMDLLVHPAQRECCGFVIAEAAGNGVPAIVSAIDGLQETVQDGVTGLVARNDSQFPFLVRQLHQNRRRLVELSINAKRVADEKYSADRIYDTILDVVRSHLRRAG
jgi:glycosyltransferase involved in cell wall biosynthesis